MQFRIADTFTDSLARLTGDEQKAVKTTVFDLHVNPANPGHSFHKLDRARDKRFWSVRVSRDIRIIVHRADESLLVCYAGHHDDAYDWAERRKLETHPATGAAQFVQIRETVHEIAVPVYVAASKKAPEHLALFATVAREDLLSYGVPEEWLGDVITATEDSYLALAEHLPAEAAEALLQLATGGKPIVRVTATPAANPFDHPDAQRRFRVMTNVDELERALEYPWDKWTVFLHPDQREMVERDYAGPARVSGSAGTGKTIVALHRAVHLARSNPEARVLLGTFSDVLANALRSRLKRLVYNEPRLMERMDVYSLDAIGLRLYKSHIGPVSIASRDVIVELIQQALKDTPGHNFGMPFVVSEWEQVVDAWQLENWDAYRDVVRLGRKTRLPEPQRVLLWSIFEQIRASLAARNLMTQAGMFTRLAPVIMKLTRSPFDFIVIDEAQDLSISQLRFLAALGAKQPSSLFFAGDLGQRIFQQPFSWKALGVDIRGRSRTLRVNYRTSHQIRSQADRLLGPQVSDVDGNAEDRKDTVSVFNGDSPSIRSYPNEAAEIAAVAAWLAERSKSGVAAHEIGVFVRSNAQLDRARRAVEGAALPFRVLDDHVETASGFLSISTMHLAKGLEFRSVVVMACDDEVIPLQKRIETVGEDSDLREVYETERHLLYVACTRARDHLLVTSVEPASEFLDDLHLSGG
ncbi:MAG: UvrD-helicase domain-containing protein, partial [Burkholderiales bacterium]